MAVAPRAPELAHAHDHSVEFYELDRDLIASVTRFIGAGLAASGVCVVIATPEHRAELEISLAEAGFDLEAMGAAERYITLDAADTLARFMVDGRPDGERFNAVIGELVFAGAEAAGDAELWAFGEMVALLWDEGNVNGAIELEELWNDLGRRVAFTLHCAYSIASLAGAADLDAAHRVCAEHSVVLPPATYASATPAPVVTDPEDGERSQLFVPVPQAARAVRRFVVGTLAQWNLSTLADDAAVVASELATNALIHASSPFSVTITRQDSTVRIAVRDTSDVLPARRNDSTVATSGRGIALVHALAPRWGTEVAHDGKTIWAELGPTV